LLSCDVLSRATAAVDPRNGLLAANGLAEVELNALKGLLDCELVVGMLLNSVLVLVEGGKSELEGLLPNNGLDSDALLSVEVKRGLKSWEFLVELGWLEIGLFVVGNRELEDLLMSKSLVCSVILFALILGFSSEFSWESLLSSSFTLFLESVD